MNLGSSPSSIGIYGIVLLPVSSSVILSALIRISVLASLKGKNVMFGGTGGRSRSFTLGIAYPLKFVLSYSRGVRSGLNRGTLTKIKSFTAVDVID